MASCTISILKLRGIMKKLQTVMRQQELPQYGSKIILSTPEPTAQILSLQDGIIIPLKPNFMYSHLNHKIRRIIWSQIDLRGHHVWSTLQFQSWSLLHMSPTIQLMLMELSFYRTQKSKKSQNYALNCNLQAPWIEAQSYIIKTCFSIKFNHLNWFLC